MPTQEHIRPEEWPIIMTVPEVAAFLHIGRSAAYELCRTNRFRCVRIGKLIRVPRSSLLAWLESNGRPEQEEAAEDLAGTIGGGWSDKTVRLKEARDER